jgi:predicted alpha/beta-fold hydrolase
MEERAASPSSSVSSARRPFEPPRWLRGGHRQTVWPALLPAAAVSGATVRHVEVEPGTSVEVHVNRATGGPSGGARGARGRGTVLLVHGLGGHAESRYMRRTATQALERGWDVARLNLRNCGGTEALASTLYNTGQSDDIGAVLAGLEAEGLPRPFGVVSFSLGANQTLLHAGEAGAACAADAIVAVNPPVDLEATHQSIQRPMNTPYHWRYTRSLCQLVDRIRALRPVEGPAAVWWRIRSVYVFDRLFTIHGTPHATVDDYYAAASSGPLLGDVAKPTLVLASKDDPVVPFESFEPFETGAGHPVRITYPSSGGHVGFWQRGEPRYWAAEAALDFIEAETGPR